MLNLPIETKEVIVYLYSEAAAASTGRYALARIILADSSFISLVFQKYGENDYRWRTPFIQIQQNGHVDDFPNLGGPLLEQAIAIAIRAQGRIKKQIGAPPLGKTFRVSRESVELIPNPVEGPHAH